MDACDEISTSTEYLKSQLAITYHQPLEKIFVVPNLIPYYMFGHRFNPDMKVAQRKQNREKPRIGLIGSISHFNIPQAKDKDGKLLKDDCSDLVELILELHDKFHFVLLGYCPPELDELAKQGKIEIVQSCSIYNYPTMLHSLGL